MRPSSTIFFVSILSLTSSTLIARDTIQGWALVEDVCPSGTDLCGVRSCCPFGSYCDTLSSPNSNFCCPTSDACGVNVMSVPGESRCALSSWNLFNTTKDPICCLPGEVGLNPTPDEEYGHCRGHSGDQFTYASTATIISSKTLPPITTGTFTPAPLGATLITSGSAAATSDATGAATAATTTSTTSSSQNSASSPSATKNAASVRDSVHAVLIGLTMFGGLVALQ